MTKSAGSYEYEMPGGAHWSFRIRRGMVLKLTDREGGANVGMLFYNPDNLLERYNAPDTLKCQHTFKLTKGNCLYSDMGRIFCSIIDDSLGWHETVCGNLHSSHVEERWGKSSYQEHGNDRYQNGVDSFLVELAKYGLSRRDMAANVNFFSRVQVEDAGELVLAESGPGSVSLRFEMDTLVLMHTCPHPLNKAEAYPARAVLVEMYEGEPVTEDDYCKNFRAENGRGFDNNRIYHLGMRG